MARTARIESRKAQLAAERARIEAEAKAALARLAAQEADAERELKAARANEDKRAREQARHDDLVRAEILGRYLIRVRDSDDRKLYDRAVNAMAPTLRRNGQRALFGLEPLASTADPDPEDAAAASTYSEPKLTKTSSATGAAAVPLAEPVTA